MIQQLLLGVRSCLVSSRLKIRSHGPHSVDSGPTSTIFLVSSLFSKFRCRRCSAIASSIFRRFRAASSSAAGSALRFKQKQVLAQWSFFPLATVSFCHYWKLPQKENEHLTCFLGPSVESKKIRQNHLLSMIHNWFVCEKNCKTGKIGGEMSNGHWANLVLWTHWTHGAYSPALVHRWPCCWNLREDRSGSRSRSSGGTSIHSSRFSGPGVPGGEQDKYNDPPIFSRSK